MTDLRRDLLAFLADSQVPLPEDFDDDTPLLSSGALDSLALFNLVLWIEEKSGRSIDPTEMDIVRAWDSVRLVLDYVEGGGEAPAAAHARPAPPTACGGRIRIVPYDARHGDAVARFQTGLWSPDVGANRRYLAWKHEENPYAEEPRLYLAFDGDELVGMRGFYGSRWQVGSPTAEVDLLVADDLLVEKAHRDEGLVTAIMQAAFEDLRGRGAAYVLNLSGGPVTILGSLAMGWRSAGSLRAVGLRSRGQRLRARVREGLRSMPYLWRYERSSHLVGALERTPLERFDAHLGPVADGKSEIELTDVPRVEEMAALIDEMGHDGRLRHVRDATFLAWRLRHPLNRYRFVYAGGDRLAGYLVLKWGHPRRVHSVRVSIVDLEARDERTCRALLEAAIRIGRFPELTTWRAALPPTAGGVLDDAGFAPVDPAQAAHGFPSVLVRALDEGSLGEDWTLRGTRLLDPSSWDLRMLHTMAG